MSIAQSVLDGNRLALARLLTQIENNTLEGRRALNELFPHTGNAHLIGVTGAPGTGKSSLVNYLARHYRLPGESDPRQVAIVAIDPSSPFTGGAILGDRVRMRDLSGDPGVFIRSMASRGSLGGLATATSSVVQVLDAAGFGIILIETVGAGQAEVDIARLAHTTIVIEAPGFGDDIQAIKAGILEIADILVVNKADRPGAELTERALRSMLQLANPSPRPFTNRVGGSVESQPIERETILQESVTSQGQESPVKEVPVWVTPIQRTVATDGRGVPALAQAIANHYRYLQDSGELKRREQARLKAELDLLLRETLVSRWRETVLEGEYNQALHRLVLREISPWQAVESLMSGDFP